LKKWFLHFQDLLNQPGVVGANIDEYLPCQKEVWPALDDPFSEEELNFAISQLGKGKATGSDGLPIELDRYCMGDQQRRLLLAAFNGALLTGEVLPAFKDVTISVLFKKGSKMNCNHYRGISIINHHGKLFERLVQNRLLPFAVEVGCIPESQCGFMPGRSTVDALLVSKLLSTFALEQDRPMYKCFIDLTKAYDKVDRQTLWRILQRLGVPPNLLRVIVNLHEGSMARVKVDGEKSEAFELRRGLKQGSVFAPLLFNIFFGTIIKAFHAECQKVQNIELGVKFNVDWRNNFVLNQFVNHRVRQNTSRNALAGGTTPTATMRLMEILFADDCELFAESGESLQLMVNIFVKVARTFAQEVSVEKTKVIVVEKCRSEAVKICIEDAELENVDDFVYLGSKESKAGDMSAEVTVRVQRMETAFRQWEGRILMNPRLSRRLRLVFFNLTVIANGLYGCATWNLCKKQITDLERKQFQLLKRICGLSRDKRASYEDVMRIAELAGCPVVPLECTIAKLQLRYLGHIERMDKSRLQKQILSGRLELPGGKARRGAPARNYRLTIVDALRKFGYSAQSWREIAANRSEWRHHLNSVGKDYFVQNWLYLRAERRRKRHNNDDNESMAISVEGDESVERLVAVEEGEQSELCVVNTVSSVRVSRKRCKNLRRAERRRVEFE
jgi:hypothetical protein